MPDTNETTLAVEGMSCGHCQQAVEDALASVPGVDTVNVSLDEAQASVAGAADPDALVAAVEDAGYTARHA